MNGAMNSETPSTVFQVEPARTLAVVVGIAHYEGLPSGSIPTAADKAQAFAEWLVNRDVPKDRVLLYLTRKDPLPTLGSKPATHANLVGAFLETLKALGIEEDPPTLLIVYWVGHGFIDDDENRKLYCGDATLNNQSHIDFNELRRVLRTQGFPRRQIFLIDACAVPMSTATGYQLGFQKFTSGPRNTSCRQFVLFSTTEDEVSPGLSPNDPRSFHRVLLEAIGKVIGDDKSNTVWPPDMPVVAKYVQEAFKDPSLPQHPRFLSIGWDGDVDDTAMKDPAAGRVNDVQVRVLADALEMLPIIHQPHGRTAFLQELSKSLAYGLRAEDKGAFAERLARNVLAAPDGRGEFLVALARFKVFDEETLSAPSLFTALDQFLTLPNNVRWQHVARLVRHLAGIDDGPPIDPDVFSDLAYLVTKEEAAARELPVGALTDPSRTVTYFAEVILKGHPQPPPLLTFVARLAARTGSPLRERLKGWVKSVAWEVGVKAPQSGSESMSGPTRLVVLAEPFGKSAATIDVKAWELREGQEPSDNLGDGPTRCDRLPELINEWLKNLKGELSVDLFLPVELLVEGVSGWSVKVAPRATRAIDERYPVRLRSWNRLYDREHAGYFDEQAVNAWVALWKKRPARGALPAEAHFADLHEAGHYETQVLVSNQHKCGPICVAASLMPPGSESEPCIALDVLTTLLVVGIPIIVWPAPRAAADEAPGAVSAKIRKFVMKAPLETLPSRVFSHRSAPPSTADDEPPAAWRLCLLWDDPEELPPNHDDALIQPTRA